MGVTVSRRREQAVRNGEIAQQHAQGVWPISRVFPNLLPPPLKYSGSCAVMALAQSQRTRGHRFAFPRLCSGRHKYRNHSRKDSLDELMNFLLSTAVRFCPPQKRVL